LLFLTVVTEEYSVKYGKNLYSIGGDAALKDDWRIDELRNVNIANIANNNNAAVPLCAVQTEFNNAAP